MVPKSAEANDDSATFFWKRHHSAPTKLLFELSSQHSLVTQPRPSLFREIAQVRGGI